MRALNRLNAAKFRIHISEHATVGEVVAAFKAGGLQTMRPSMACAHHGHGHP